MAWNHDSGSVTERMRGLHPKMREALRDGSISMDVMNTRKTRPNPPGPPKFSTKRTESTRAEKSRLEPNFDTRERDEGSTSKSAYGKGQIDDRKLQRTPNFAQPAKELRSGKVFTGKQRGSRAQAGGGGVVGSDTPGRKHIDDYHVRKTFPAGAVWTGRPDNSGKNKTGNTKMKGKAPLKSGGPMGHNARNKSYYGGPNNHRDEGTY